MRSSPRPFGFRRSWVRPVAVVLAGGVGLLAVASYVGAADDAAADKPAAEKPAAEKPAAKKAPAAKPTDDKAAADEGAEKVTYVKHIQPILKESCVQCHRVPPANAGRGPGAPGSRPGGPGGPPGAPGARRPAGPGAGPGGPGMRGPAGGLRLDDKALLLKGGKHGKAVVPGKGEDSLLYKVLKEPVTIENEEIHAMPKARQGQEFTPIADEEIEIIKKWIDQGAK